MTEFLFVLKCLIATAVLVVFMQLKVGGASIESYTFHWLRRSAVSQYIQSVAAGGIMATKNLGKSVKDGVVGAADSYKQGSEEQAQR